MEHRRLGGAGLKVPTLSLGRAAFGGNSAFFERWGQAQHRSGLPRTRCLQ